MKTNQTDPVMPPLTGGSWLITEYNQREFPLI